MTTPNIGSAVYSYIRAIRALGRMTTTAFDIAEGLRLSVEQVEWAIKNHRMPGVKLLNKKRATVGPFSNIVETNKRKKLK